MTRSVYAVSSFTAALWAALTCVSFIQIYAFDYFEGAIGSRIDNLILNTFLNVGVSLLVALGLGVVLVWRRASRVPTRYVQFWLPASATIACGVIYAFGLAGSKFSAFYESWQINLGLVAVFCVVVGVLVASTLVRSLRVKGCAA